MASAEASPTTHRPKRITAPRVQWVATLNNPKGKEDDPATWLVPACKWAVWQLETGRAGTPHYQIAFGLHKKSRLSALKALHVRAHYEVMRGTPSEAAAYCKKEEGRLRGPWEHGTVPHAGQGARNDLHVIKEMLDGGLRMFEVADAHFGTFVRNYRGLQQYRLLRNDQQRDWPMDIRIFYGPTGTGKTRRALYEATKLCQPHGCDPYWLAKPGGGGTVWFDGFDSNHVVVIDEFYGWIPYDTMLRLLDRYPQRVETKGGTVNFNAHVIIITSNQSPEEWYAKVADRSALMRRIDGKCHYMDGQWEPPVEEATTGPTAIGHELEGSALDEAMVEESESPQGSRVARVLAANAKKKKKRPIPAALVCDYDSDLSDSETTSDDSCHISITQPWSPRP